jgi:hypothetical protein
MGTTLLTPWITGFAAMPAARSAVKRMVNVLSIECEICLWIEV